MMKEILESVFAIGLIIAIRIVGMAVFVLLVAAGVKLAIG